MWSISILQQIKPVRMWVAIISAAMAAGCASTKPVTSPAPTPSSQIASSPISQHKLSLADRSYFHQKDPRWSALTLGGSQEPLSTDGCLVTSAAMALANLGFQTNPADLVTRLKKVDGFTNQGWLVWSGIEKVTGGIAQTRFYKSESTAQAAAQSEACLSDGFYPLVRFKLPSRRSHWAMIVAQTENGFYMRDPMVQSKWPIALSSQTRDIDAVRCIGVPKPKQESTINAAP